MSTSENAPGQAPPTQSKLTLAVLFFLGCAVVGKFMGGVAGTIELAASVAMASMGVFGLLATSKGPLDNKAIASVIAIGFFAVATFGLINMPFGISQQKATQSASEDGASSGIDLTLSPAEQAEVNQIKSADKLTAQMGHEISPNTTLSVVFDNFGEHPKCMIQISGTSNGTSANGKWNLVVQTTDSPIIWTNNMMSDSAGEIRLSFAESGNRYSLANPVSASGRAAVLTDALIKDLSTAKQAKASSGMLGGTELSVEYDLSAAAKAYRYAKAVCP